MDLEETGSSRKSNKLPVIGIVLAVIGFFMLGSVDTESALEKISVPAGLFGIVCVVLCVIGLKRSRTVGKGKVLSIVGIVLGLLVGMSVLRPALNAARHAARTQVMANMAGKPAPTFSMTTADGDLISNETLAGTPFVLAFHPSPEAFPKLDALHEYCEARSIPLFAVVPADVAERIEGFSKRNGFSVPVMRNPDSDTFSDFLLHSGPGVLIVAADGSIIQVLDGVDYEGAVKQAVTALPAMNQGDSSTSE